MDTEKAYVTPGHSQAMEDLEIIVAHVTDIDLVGDCENHLGESGKGSLFVATTEADDNEAFYIATSQVAAVSHALARNLCSNFRYN